MKARKLIQHTNIEILTKALDNIEKENFRVQVKEGGFDFEVDVTLHKNWYQDGTGKLHNAIGVRTVGYVSGVFYELNEKYEVLKYIS